MTLAAYGGPASWAGNGGGAYTFLKANGYLHTGAVATAAPTATLFGAPYEVDLLGYAVAPRSNNLWVFSYLFLAPASAAADPAVWVEAEFSTFLAAVSGAGSSGGGPGNDTGTLHVFTATADLSDSTSRQARARFLDASISSDTRAFGGLEILLTWRLYQELG